VKDFKNSIMKKNTRLFVGIAMAVVIGGTLVSANATVDKNAIKAAFAKAPGAEMPYIANSLVAKAKKADKAETAMEVLRVAVAKKPAVCVSVVSFVCALVPDAAADIAAEAVKLTPQYTREIARAAAKAAPAQIGKITIALLKATKAKKHQMVYNSVVAAVPSLFRTVNQALLAGGSSDSKGAITTVGSPIAALGADGKLADASIVFPDPAPTPVTATAGIDPARYNAPD
jgi:NADH dehydrogenase/NADH:ubiquinone oxidoreductase subunit G